MDLILAESCEAATIESLLTEPTDSFCCNTLLEASVCGAPEDSISSSNVSIRSLTEKRHAIGLSVGFYEDKVPFEINRVKNELIK